MIYTEERGEDKGGLKKNTRKLGGFVSILPLMVFWKEKKLLSEFGVKWETMEFITWIPRLGSNNDKYKLN